MAKAMRVSLYYVSKDDYLRTGFKSESFTDNYGTYQQVHVEESEPFEPDGELEPNCDLALLTRHFKHKPEALQFDRPLPKIGESYRHFKIGKVVRVLGISRHTETEEVMVVYDHEGTLWSRPLDMFMSEVDKEKYPDAEQKYRFEKVED